MAILSFIYNFKESPFFFTANYNALIDTVFGSVVVIYDCSYKNIYFIYNSDKSASFEYIAKTLASK